MINVELVIKKIIVLTILVSTTFILTSCTSRTSTPDSVNHGYGGTGGGLGGGSGGGGGPGGGR